MEKEEFREGGECFGTAVWPHRFFKGSVGIFFDTIKQTRLFVSESNNQRASVADQAESMEQINKSAIL